MNNHIRIILLMLLSLVASTAWSAPMQQEIEHLLEFVASTQCQYERNGTKYSGKKAVAHIQKKYRYFKDDIDSTEKFIELSATKSTMSGRYYNIHCKNKPVIKTQDWLLQELQTYRNAAE
ncbi:MAG: DUF5329 family protein [Mariprofundales bacterium]